MSKSDTVLSSYFDFNFLFMRLHGFEYHKNALKILNEICPDFYLFYIFTSAGIANVFTIPGPKGEYCEVLLAVSGSRLNPKVSVTSGEMAAEVEDVP